MAVADKWTTPASFGLFNLLALYAMNARDATETGVGTSKLRSREKSRRRCSSEASSFRSVLSGTEPHRLVPPVPRDRSWMSSRHRKNYHRSVDLGIAIAYAWSTEMKTRPRRRRQDGSLEQGRNRSLFARKHQSREKRESHHAARVDNRYEESAWHMVHGIWFARS